MTKKIPENVAVPHETICEKARRLIFEERDNWKKQFKEREFQFMESLFGKNLEGVEIKKDKTGLTYYRICGRDWYPSSDPYTGYVSFLRGYGKYKGIEFTYHFSPTLETNKIDKPKAELSLLRFGEALIELDKIEESLRLKYPDTWWGNFKARWRLFFERKY